MPTSTISSAADQAARLIRSGTHPLDAASIAANQHGLPVSAVRAEMSRRSGARRRTTRRILRGAA